MSGKFHVGNVNDRKIFFRKPAEIGFFSEDGLCNFHNDSRQMKWIYKPPSGWDTGLSPDLHWDLNLGYSEAIRKDFETKIKLKHLLQWILLHKEQIWRDFFSTKSNDLKIDFVCERGLLRKICNTPYDRSNDWCFYASKFKSIIYMCAIETDKAREERENETEISKVMTLWGAKFEQYMTTSEPNSEPNTLVPVNENGGFYVVLKGQMNEYSLMYSAETDGKDPGIPQKHFLLNDNLKSMDCYIELKTTRNGAEHGRYYGKKLLSWWLQSFLAGIPRIICGVRDKTGVVEKLKTYQVENIPEIARNEGHTWNKEICLKYCYKILKIVKECIQEDNPKIVYKFFNELDPSYVKCEQLDPGEYKILPTWFTDNIK